MFAQATAQKRALNITFARSQSPPNEDGVPAVCFFSLFPKNDFLRDSDAEDPSLARHTKIDADKSDARRTNPSEGDKNMTACNTGHCPFSDQKSKSAKLPSCWDVLHHSLVVLHPIEASTE